MCFLAVCGPGEVISGGLCKGCNIDYYSDVQLPNSETMCEQCPGMTGTRTTGSTMDKCEGT